MTKKIKLYKLIKEEYTHAVIGILMKDEIFTGYLTKYQHIRLEDIGKSLKETSITEKGFYIYVGNSGLDAIKKAGVLDLWFEPIYEEIDEQKEREIWEDIFKEFEKTKYSDFLSYLIAYYQTPIKKDI